MSEAEAREKTERMLKVGRAARARIMGGLVLAVPVLLLKLHWIYIVFLSLYILQSVINLLFIRKGMGLYIASYLRTGLDLVLVTWAVHFAGAHSSIVIIAYPLICVLCTVSNTLRMGVTMSVLGSGLYLSLLVMEYRGVLPHPPLLAGMPYDASSIPMLLSSWIIMSLSMFGGTFAAGGIMRQLREKDEELEKAHGELKKLFREREVERVRLSEELKEAREIQERLFPRLDRPIKGLEIDGACMISQEVGGDYYDVSADRQGRVAVWIGDVSGKGAGAALVMTMIKSACNLSVPSLGSPRDLLVMLNAHLRALAPTRSMTFFFMTADIPGRRLIFSNAGHPTPYLCRRQGSLEALELSSFPLGIVEDAEYEVREVPCNPGDVIVLYSDGVVEARARGGEFFGFERLEDSIRRNAGGNGRRPAREIKEGILNDLRGFLGGEPLIDDATLMVLCFSLSPA